MIDGSETVTDCSVRTAQAEVRAGSRAAAVHRGGGWAVAASLLILTLIIGLCWLKLTSSSSSSFWVIDRCVAVSKSTSLSRVRNFCFTIFSSAMAAGC
jgi:hypothetical protein